MKFWGKSHLSFNVLPKAVKGKLFMPGKGDLIFQKNKKQKQNRTVIQEKRRTTLTTERISESLTPNTESGVWCYIRIYQSLF